MEKTITDGKDHLKRLRNLFRFEGKQDDRLRVKDQCLLVVQYCTVFTGTLILIVNKDFGLLVFLLR